MFAGAVHVITGVAFVTVIDTLLVAVVYATASVGVNVTDSVWVPAPSTVPAAGEYAKVPGTLAVAFNCDAPSFVPYTIAEGAGHVIVGVVAPAAAATTSTAARLKRSVVGAVSLICTTTPALAVGVVVFWTQ